MELRVVLRRAIWELKYNHGSNSFCLMMTNVMRCIHIPCMTLVIIRHGVFTSNGCIHIHDFGWFRWIFQRCLRFSNDSNYCHSHIRKKLFVITLELGKTRNLLNLKQFEMFWKQKYIKDFRTCTSNKFLRCERAVNATLYYFKGFFFLVSSMKFHHKFHNRNFAYFENALVSRFGEN